MPRVGPSALPLLQLLLLCGAVAVLSASTADLLPPPPPHRMVHYFVYEPRKFLANAELAVSPFVPKHSIDTLFFRDVFQHSPEGPPLGLFPHAEEAAFLNGTRGLHRPGLRVSDPATAELFLIPVLCSKAFGAGENKPATLARKAAHMADLVLQCVLPPFLGPSSLRLPGLTIPLQADPPDAGRGQPPTGVRLLWRAGCHRPAAARDYCGGL